MKLVKASYSIESPIDGLSMLKAIEKAGRTCYKSEDKITDDSCIKFVKMLINKGHESVLEHQSISVRFVIDRGIVAELTRHRIASFSVESTRYVNHSKKDHIEFIIPCWFKSNYNTLIKNINMCIGDNLPYEDEMEWISAMEKSEYYYYELMTNYNWTPQEARSVLPNSLKSEIVVTANLREWRTIFKQRTSKAAHPQMREVMIPLLEELQTKIPVIFNDINKDNYEIL
jgi:thymidylate synthase (FAD)